MGEGPRNRAATERMKASAAEHFKRQGMSSAEASRTAESRVRESANRRDRQHADGSSRNKARRVEKPQDAGRATGKTFIDLGKKG